MRNSVTKMTSPQAVHAIYQSVIWVQPVRQISQSELIAWGPVNAGPANTQQPGRANGPGCSVAFF